MSFRAFISVDIERNEGVESLQAGLRKTGANLKLVDLNNIHLTLKFLGNTDEALVPKIKNIMEEGVANMAPFELELRGVGAFPNVNRMQVLWVGTRNAEGLGDLASYLQDELDQLGFKKEKRRFSPHITLARVRSGRNLDAVRAVLGEYTEERFGVQTIDRIRLKKSDLRPSGPIYTVVEEAHFGKTNSDSPQE
jgi:2'-5' RNA ligase